VKIFEELWEDNIFFVAQLCGCMTSTKSSLWDRFPEYKIDMILKDVKSVQQWTYFPRIDEWTILYETYPDIWKGVLRCTDAYKELNRRESMPRCEQDFCFCTRTLHGNHFKTFSHRHNHTSNLELQKLAYIESLELIGDHTLTRPSILEPSDTPHHDTESRY